MSRLILKVSDREGKICCKVVLKKMCDSCENHEAESTETVYCNGGAVFQLKEGFYELAVYRGKLYWPYREVISAGGEDIIRSVQLERVIDPASLGMYSFDAHSHVSRNISLNTGNLVNASTIMKGEDFNFFFAGSPYDHETHLQYINRDFSDNLPYRKRYSDIIRQVEEKDFRLDIGNELIKCRYGHVFMMNYLQKPPFSKYFDEAFDPWLFDKQGDEPAYEIKYIYEALLTEKEENSVAVAAHPTSWWWHRNGEFITNIAATLGFEILAQSIDAMVVMGYESDRASYQELWYDALRNGYFLPGVAETDAAFDTVPGKKLDFKTFVLAEEFGIDALCKAVKQGRCMVSSGPLLIMKINGHLPGDVLKFGRNTDYVADVQAHRCYQAELSKIQIIVDGHIFKEFDASGDTFYIRESIPVEKECFILAKCYDRAGNVAFTNPVYIRNQPFINRGYTSHVTIHVKSNGKDASGTYRVDEGREIPFEGVINLKIKVSSKITVTVGEETKVVRLFELPELQAIFRNLYFGWFTRDKKYNPGEVPAEEFKLARIREILDRVSIDLCFGREDKGYDN